MERQKELQFCKKVDELKNSMYAVSMGILRNESDAEDAIQNTVLSAYRFFDTLSVFEKFKPWILKILTIECYKILKKKRESLSYSDELNNTVSGNDSYSEIDTRLVVWNAVCSLEEIYRIPVILFYYENLSIKDIGNITNENQNVVKKRLQRAREKLKEKLKEDDFR